MLNYAYISVAEALKHSGYANDAEVKPTDQCQWWWQRMADFNWCDGIIVPGGFGQRGTKESTFIMRVKMICSNVGVRLGMQLIRICSSF